MSAAGAGWHPSGFFVLRTPLLPLDVLIEWAGADHAEADRVQETEPPLVAALLRLARRPDVREALFLASRALSDALVACEESAAPPTRRLVLALARYVARMASRPTPFGLMAGYSVGVLGAQTHLQLAPASFAEKRLQLGLHLLGRVADRVAADASLCAGATLRPNSSLYAVAGQQRYVEVHETADGRGHQLQALRGGPELNLALELAQAGIGAADLAQDLSRRLHAPLASTSDYVERLVANQVLVVDVQPRVTSPDPSRDLVARLHATPGARAVAAGLESLAAQARQVAARGVGTPPGDYAPIEQAALRLLGAPMRADEALHVVLRKPAPGLALDAALAPELQRGAEALRRVFADPALDSLRELREGFVERYEGRFVPLLEALDHELGQGLQGLGVEASDDPPLLRGLGLAAPPVSPRALPCHAPLLERVGRALAAHEHEICLTDADIDRLSLPRALPLPDAFAVVGHVMPQDLPGGLRFSLYSVLGPSGARLLGRFCQGDARLEALVRGHLRDEEALRPEALFAELVSLPRGHSANIVARPTLREHDVPFLGTSQLPLDRQIAASDLLLGVREERFVLWSRLQGREVVPRVTNAHNVTAHGVGLYRFLTALQTQGVASALFWDWGPLAALPFLPRVRLGGLALSRATWRVSADELRPLTRGTSAERLAAARAWAASRRLLRCVVFAEADHELLVDFENVISLDAFLAVALRREQVLLRELLPGPETPAVRGPEGGYANEVVIPFVRRQSNRAPRAVAPPDESAVGRSHAPCGGEWLYVKLYTGYATADRLLVDTLRPLAERLLADGALDSWFFVRYHDPAFHLRVRFHGPPAALWGEVLRAVGATCAPLVDAGWIARLQLDTYVREVERYGGQGLAVAEQIFWIDSEAVVALLPLAQADSELRWQLAFQGADALLDDLGLDLEAKTRLLARQVELYGREFQVDKPVRERLAGQLRARRAALQALACAPGAWQAIYRRRSERLREPVARLRALAREGALGAALDELAVSHVHMHLNRWFRTAPRAQELVLYDLMNRLCLSQLARARTPAALPAR